MEEAVVLRLAQRAYHACDFAEALAILEGAEPSCAATVIRIKCLYESDLGAAACAEADRHLEVFADAGALHYYRGVAYFHKGSYDSDDGTSLPIAAESFARAKALGYHGAAIGEGLIALAGGDVAGAITSLTSPIADDAELEHVRLRVLSLCCALTGDLDRAERCVRDGYAVLATFPSLLAHLWSDVSAAYIDRLRGRFDIAHAALTRLQLTIKPERAARLAEHVRDEAESLRRHDTGTDLRVPVQESPLSLAQLDELGRKRMLHTLFQSLVKAGPVGATKAELVRELWAEEYEPKRHDERLHKSINRLRRFLVECRGTSPLTLAQTGARYSLSAYARSEPAPSGAPSKRAAGRPRPRRREDSAQ